MVKTYRLPALLTIILCLVAASVVAATFTVNSPVDVDGAAPFDDGICTTAYNNGVPRPFAGTNCDIGAFESQAIVCPGSSLQNATDNAVPGQIILVIGSCSENLLVRNEKQRITIDGSGGGTGTRATIAGSGGSPTVNIRGKGILLQNFNISGGSDGVHINRGANAVLNNNVIQNSTDSGVIVDELAFAILTANLIQNHP